MDWHSSVYGARSGRSEDYSFHDDEDDDLDGVSAYGSLSVVPDGRLRSLGGRAYFRAHELIDSHRLYALKAREEGPVLTLSARVSSTYDLTDDYQVSARVDQDLSDLVASSCTCTAFGRRGAICKHVIALIMDYNEHFEDFSQAGERSLRAGHPRRTSRLLQAYMLHEDTARQRRFRDRQLNLLKEVDSRSGSPQAGSPLASDRHLPIGSVTLRPAIESRGKDWLVRLHVTVPAKGISYAVKDVRALLRAVQSTEFVSYGRRLAFVHSLDTFDARGQGLLSVLERAQAIRDSLTQDGQLTRAYRGRPTNGGMVLSDDEVTQILDLFVDSDLTLDYTPPERYFIQTMAARVVGEDPDLGLKVEAEDQPGGSHGYLITHGSDVECFIQGQASSYAVVRPIVPGPAGQSQPVIHRCSKAFTANRELIETLCRDGQEGDLFLDARDEDLFARTVLPVLAPAYGQEGGSAPTRGIPADLPEGLRELRRLPCQVEIYLDRDADGVVCDLQARYGQVRYHLFDPADPDTVPLRDGDTERLALQAVRHYFPGPQGGPARIPESDDKAIYTLLTEGLPVLRGLGEVFSTPAFDGLTVVSHTKVRLGLSVKSGLVEISPIADEIDPAEVPALLAEYRKRKRFHRLSSGAFVDLASLDTGRMDDLAADLSIKPADLVGGGTAVPPYAAYYLDAQVDDADKDEGFLTYLDGLKSVDPAAYQVPSGLTATLRPYQVEGFRWLSSACDQGFGGILADEMGLGKTVQMLSFLLSRQEEARRVGPDLIVCPASLVYNWAAESGRFAPDLRVGLVAGRKADRRSLLEHAGDYDLLITSYDLLRRDVDDYAGLTTFCMVLDEAQYIKNHATKAAQAVRKVQARHRFALTGTPIENRLAELWSIFDFLMPGLLGSYAHFRDRFEMPILSGDESAQARLQALVGPFILRRLKSQVLKDLPEKIENVLTVPLEGEQRRLYAALEQRLRGSLNRQRDVDFETDRIQVLAQLTRLRQVCCDPRLVYEGQEALAGAKGHGPQVSAKLEAIGDLVESCRDAGRKMLIFSQFTSFLDLIADQLRGQGVAYDMITGATSKKRRLELVDRFNSDDTPVFLISLKAGNTGLNLTGACVVVHADPWWNAAAQEQANDRAHRIGQTQDVNVYQIVAKDTIEERILNLQKAKTDLASRFVDSAAVTGSNPISRLSRQDLLNLLG
ncbi:DEAD/DEAH box helicase [Bifidobacterium favimelis]|uniref:DEAD/DEAH box helicase n=1 Tax=Bifidobacterium favimelis TaxID=3122979 RepID=A0ABU8ZPG1_9BIFI